MVHIFKTKDYELWHGDCLDLMKNIPDKSIDMVLCDLPYGITSAKWDTIIPFEPMWEEYNRVIKDKGAIVLFANEPFASKLRMSNIKNYKYDWIWVKHKPGNFSVGKWRPLGYHENICVFCYNGNKVNYYPQKIPRKSDRVKQAHKVNYIGFNSQRRDIFMMKGHDIDFNKFDADFKLPSTVLEYPAVQSNSKEKVPHPTQKPVSLLEYLIKTYTQEGETILDNCMGSGSTGVASLNLGRKFIGIELDESYFDMAKSRMETFNAKDENDE